MRVYIDVTTCKDCPFIKHDRTEGAGYALDYTCSATKDNKLIAGYVEYQSEFPKTIPGWCPFNTGGCDEI